MPSGVVDFNVVNLNDLAGKFEDGEEVSLETLTQKRLLNPSGHEAKLPLKVRTRSSSPYPCDEMLAPRPLPPSPACAHARAVASTV